MRASEKYVGVFVEQRTMVYGLFVSWIGFHEVAVPVTLGELMDKTHFVTLWGYHV